MSTVQPSNRPILLGSLFILSLLFLIILLGGTVIQWFGFKYMSIPSLFISRMLFWISLMLIWFYAIKFEKQKLLIWEEKKYNLGFYLIAIGSIFAVLFFGVTFIQTAFKLLGLQERSTVLLKMMQLLKGHYGLIFFTSLTAGVVEELIFRGYLQPRLTILFKNSTVAIVVSCLLFGLLHYQYGTIINMIGPFFIGFVFAYFYSKFRNIKIVILCHFIWDLLLLLISIHHNFNHA